MLFLNSPLHFPNTWHQKKNDMRRMLADEAVIKISFKENMKCYWSGKFCQMSILIFLHLQHLTLHQFLRSFLLTCTLMFEFSLSIKDTRLILTYFQIVIQIFYPGQILTQSDNYWWIILLPRVFHLILY